MTITQSALAGARDAGGMRQDDFYPTPPEAVHALCKHEKFTGSIWEPACGDGAISKVLTDYGYSVISTDLVNRGYGANRIDFLMERHPRAPNIVTNPPFKNSEEFARHALTLTTGKVVFLLRLVWLAGKSRGEMFRRSPLARVLIFSSRLPMMHRGGYEGPKSSSAIDFAWFVFEHGYIGKPTIDWISCENPFSVSAPVPEPPEDQRARDLFSEPEFP